CSQPPCGFAVPVVFLLPGDFGQFSETFDDAGIEFSFEQWHEDVAHSVARKLRLGVSRVLPPGLADSAEILLHFVTTHAKERTNDFARQLSGFILNRNSRLN